MVTIVSQENENREVRLDFIIYLFCHKALKPLGEIVKGITAVEFNNNIYYLVQK